MGEPRERQNRTALLHVRVKPELRARIEHEASTLNIAPSAFVRKVLAEHFMRSPK